MPTKSNVARISKAGNRGNVDRKWPESPKLEIVETPKQRIEPSVAKIGFRVWGLMWFFCCCVPGGDLNSQTSLPDDARQVESYLEQLGLDELLVEFIEQQLARQVDREDRKRTASRLAELYTQRLVSPSTTYEQSLQWQMKAQQLIQVYPDLDDPILRIAIFHARYQSVNNDFELWWQAKSPPKKKQTVDDSLRQLIRDLLQLKRQMETNRRELLIAEQMGVESGKLSELKLARVENVLLHAQYLIGWSSYFRAIVQPENKAEWLAMSDSHFRGFLQIEPNKPLLEVGEKWFDFDNGWTSRGLIGLAVCKQAERQPRISKHCFQLARLANDGIVNRLIEIWKLKGHVFNGQFDEALALIEAKLISNNSRATANYWSTVLENGVAISDRNRELGNRMVRSGMTGLVRNRRADLLRDSFADLDLKLEGTDFLSLWISGFLAYSEAERDGDQNKFEEARIRLSQALNTVSDESNPTDVARCEFLLATIRFQSREFALAESMLKNVVNTLQNTDRALASQAMWRRIQSLVELSREDSRRSSQAFAAMDQLLRVFPESPIVDRIEFEKLKLEIQSLPDDEAIRRLKRIPPESEFQTAAKYEMIQRQHNLWIDAVRRGRANPVLLETLNQWEMDFRRDEKASVARKLRLMLLVIDARLHETPMDQKIVTQLLSETAPLAESNRKSQEELYFEYRYYRFLFLQKVNIVDATAEATWIVENATGSKYEQPALIFLAQRWNEQTADQEMGNEQVLAGIGIYQRLLEVTGSERERLKSSVNARVAAMRLAELHAYNQNWLAADRLLAQLLDCFPNNQQYLAAAGRSKTQLGRTDLARSIWRKLSLGVEAGSELWYESKYELAACLAREDKNKARRLLLQTINLSPNMPPSWRKKFQVLQAILDEN